MYQKCPICDGRGDKNNPLSNEYRPCKTCKGSGLIHTITGQPPQSPKDKEPDVQRDLLEAERQLPWRGETEPQIDLDRIRQAKEEMQRNLERVRDTFRPQVDQISEVRRDLVELGIVPNCLRCGYPALGKKVES